MSVILIIAAYVAVWMLYGWRLTIHLLDVEVRRLLREYPNLYPTQHGGATKAADEERGMYILAGFGLAAIWPAVAPVRAVYRLADNEAMFRTPSEGEEAERRELEQLRKFARENGLPLPEFDSSKGAA